MGGMVFLETLFFFLLLVSLILLINLRENCPPSRSVKHLIQSLRNFGIHCGVVLSFLSLTVEYIPNKV